MARAAANPGTTGWSYIAFPGPIAVSVNDQLLLDVHRPNGSYSYRTQGFTNRSITSQSGCMRSPASTTLVKNGMYSYSPTPAMPTLSYADSEYFISPEFSRTPVAPDTTPPTANVTNPTSGASLSGTVNVSLSFADT